MNVGARSLLTACRRGIFREGEGCGGRPEKYVLGSNPQPNNSITDVCRYTTTDGGQPGQGDPSGNDQFDEAMI